MQGARQSERAPHPGHVPREPCATGEDLRAAVAAVLAALDAKPAWDVVVEQLADSETDSDEERELLRGMTAKEKRKYLRAKKKRAVKKKRVKKRAVTTGKESVEKRVKDTILREDVAAAGTDVLLAGRDFRLCLEVPPAEAGAEPPDAWCGVPGGHVRGERTLPPPGTSVPREVRTG